MRLYLDGEEQLNEHEYYRRQNVKMKRNLLLDFTYAYAVIVSDSEPCYTDYWEKATKKVNIARRRDGEKE